jgi:hypothetical protein
MESSERGPTARLVPSHVPREGRRDHWRVCWLVRGDVVEVLVKKSFGYSVVLQIDNRLYYAYTTVRLARVAASS